MNGSFAIKKKHESAITDLAFQQKTNARHILISEYYYYIQPDTKGDFQLSAILSRIDLYFFEYQRCTLSNKAIGSFLGKDRARAHRITQKLQDYGFITIEIKDEDPKNKYRIITRTSKDIQPYWFPEAKELGLIDDEYIQRFIVGGVVGEQQGPSNDDKSEDTTDKGVLSVSNRGVVGEQHNSNNIKIKTKLLKRKNTFKKLSTPSDGQRDKPKAKLLLRKSKRRILQKQDLTPKPERKKPKKKQVIQLPKEVRWMIKLWNDKSATHNGIPKRLNETHGGNQTKRYQETVQICKDWLKGTLYQSGYGVIPDKMPIKEDIHVPKTYRDFVEYVDRFMSVLLDRAYQPRSKKFICDNSNMKDFLAGNRFSNMPAHILRYCLNEPESVYEYKYPEYHDAMIKGWEKYTRNGHPTGNDIVNFDKALAWFVPFLNTTSPFKIKNTISVHLFESIKRSWRTKRPSTSYLASAACKENFKDYLKTIE